MTRILFVLKIVDVTVEGKIALGITTQHTTKQTCPHTSVSDNCIQGKNKNKICTLEYYFINKNYAKHISVKNCHENFKDIRKYDLHKTMCMKRYCSTCKHTFLSLCTFTKHLSNCMPKQF